MMFGNPFFNDYDNDNGYSLYKNKNNNRRYAHQQRQQAAEETRRRAELEQERYYRMKELEEQEKLRQRQEYYARRLRQREQEEEAYELAAMRRRQQIEEEQRRQRLRELQLQRRREQEEAEEEPVYRVVRGPDGWLYRMNVGRQQKSNVDTSVDKENLSRNANKETANRVSSSSPPLYENPSPGVASSVEETSTTLPRKKLAKPKLPRKKSKKRVTILVEDASDSESEDEFKSVWRNRRPSPGEWIEPIENFEDLHIVN